MKLKERCGCSFIKGRNLLNETIPHCDFIRSLVGNIGWPALE